MAAERGQVGIGGAPDDVDKGFGGTVGADRVAAEFAAADGVSALDNCDAAVEKILETARVGGSEKRCKATGARADDEA